MPTPTAPARSTVRTVRSRSWTAFSVALTAMLGAFVALLIFELDDFAASGAPLVVVASQEGPANMQVVTISEDQVATSANHAVTLRLRNESDVPLEVAVTLDSPAVTYGGTLTAALTAQGAVVRSGALNVLRVPSLHLDARSTTPLTLELDVNDTELREMWRTHGDLKVVIAPAA